MLKDSGLPSTGHSNDDDDDAIDAMLVCWYNISKLPKENVWFPFSFSGSSSLNLFLPENILRTIELQVCLYTDSLLLQKCIVSAGHAVEVADKS